MEFGWNIQILESFCIVCVMSLFMTIHAQQIDNGIIGEPRVNCESDKVQLSIQTQRPFNGKIFVRGHYADPQCKIDYMLKSSDTVNASIVVQHGACDMQRQRMINPHGMQLSTIIIVSFHPIFITSVDKSYNVKCMYREAENTVKSELEVSALTTLLITDTFPMPQCSYTIRKDEIDGEILRYARVGDQVVHRWECETDVFGMLVHSCYVQDGQGEKVFIIDENGCHTDRYILGDPTYVQKLNMAYRESHVFKFADRVLVRFQCQIRLCVKLDDGCKGITPPICASFPEPPVPLVLTNRSRDTNSSQSASNVTLFDLARIPHERVKRGSHGFDGIFEPIDADFGSQDVYVLESTEDPENDPYSNPDWNQSISDHNKGAICISLPAFTSLVSLIAIVLLSAAFAIICVSLYGRRARKIDQHESSHANHITKINTNR